MHGLVSLLDQETRSHLPQLRVCMLQLKILSAAAKTRCSQINKYKEKSGPRISIAIFFKDTQMFNKHMKRCSNISLCMCMLSCFSPHLTFCNPTDCSPAVSSVHGILQARILEWVAPLEGGVPSSRESSQPRDQTCVSYISCIGRCVLYH